MEIVRTFAELRARARAPVALVPTMGYLHEGHLSLVAGARADDPGSVVMSIFVNPLQFGPDEDFDRYPRDLARDASLAEAAGVDFVFAPEVDEMYPVPPETAVTVAGPAEPLEGAFRPGHFVGVATVVAKLFAGVQPRRAYFGRKDAQQLAVIRAMTRDLSFPVEVHGMPIVREADGLALSSRNMYLSAQDRATALELSRSLFAAADLVEATGSTVAAADAEALVRSRLEHVPGLQLDYVAFVDAASVQPVERVDRRSFLALAARVGSTRLIDNVHFDLGPDGPVADRGLLLERPSILYDDPKET